MIRRWHVAAVAVALVANAVALVQVARDRRDPPSAALWLTERELRLLEPQLDSSLRFVRMTWADEGASVGVFGEDALRRLGFDCTVPVDDPEAIRHYERQLARPAWLLLEYEGEAWKAWRERGGADRRTDHATRLFPIAVGPDSSETWARCADPARCLLLPVHVRAHVAQRQQAKPHLDALVLPVSAREIAVPTRLRETLAGLPVRATPGAESPATRHRRALTLPPHGQIPGRPALTLFPRQTGDATDSIAPAKPAPAS